MMRRIAVLLVFAALFLPDSHAQKPDSIKGNPDYAWAEGHGISPAKSDEKALEGLLRKLSGAGMLDMDESALWDVWLTYLPDLRRVSHKTASSSGNVIRYMAWRDAGKIFDPRWNKVRELVSSAKAADDKDVARTYAFWAETYLRSLPSVNHALRAEVATLQKSLGQGRKDAVRIRNIETEVTAINRALSGGRKALAQTNEVSGSREEKTAGKRPVHAIEAESPAVRDTLAALPQVPDISGNMGVDIQSDEVNPVIAFSATNTPVRKEAPGSRFGVLGAAEIGKVPSVGGMLVMSGKKAGLYVSAFSNFCSGAHEYDCSSDGSTDYGYVWATDSKRTSRIAVSVGPVIAINRQVSLYAGCGYGAERTLWQDSAGKWVRVTDLSHEGMKLDAGVLLSFHGLVFSAGAGAISFSTVSASIGVGWMF